MNRRHFATRTTLAAAALASPRASAADDRPWRVAVIGHTGRGGYGHGLDVMWRTIPRTVVVGVADPVAAGLAAARTSLGGVPGFAEYRAMLDVVRADVVAIGPRHIDQHHAMSLAAVAAGARGLYIEKPFCRTPREADDIVAACAEKNVKLAVAHRNRYHPVLPVIKQLVAAAFGLQLIGTAGVIDFRIDREPLAHLRRGNPQNPLAASQPWLAVSSAGIDRPESIPDLAARIASHRAAGEDLIDAIEHDRAPLCDAAEGRTTIEMICAIFESHRHGGARVTLPLAGRENPLTLM